MTTSPTRTALMDVALGDSPADCIITGGQIVNVLSGDIHAGDLLIKGNRIAALLEPGHSKDFATKRIDASGLFLVPGFIDPHMHIESSAVSTVEFARAVVSRGITTIVIDPHEFGNIVGIDGIRALFDSAAGLPLRMLLRVPARVPEMYPYLETPGATIDRPTTQDMLAWPEAACLAGDINPQLILRKDPEQLWRIDATLAAGRTVSGYVPPMSIEQMNAMVAAGLEDSHVAQDIDELRNNLRLGLHALLTPRPGRFEAKDFADLARELNAGRLDSRRISLCTDDVLVHELVADGHLDVRIKMAIEAGIAPITAIQMATSNTSRLLRRDRDLGCLAAGRLADIVMLDDLDKLTVRKVMFEGELSFEDGGFTVPLPAFEWPEFCRDTIKISSPVKSSELSLAAPDGTASVECRIVETGYPKKLLTDTLDVVDGRIQPSIEKDRLAVAVLDRHQGTGNIGKGFVAGIGLHKGAIASSINHNCHHLFSVGADFESMAIALNRLREIKGGYVAVADGKVVAEIALPIIGMISDLPADELTREFQIFEKTIRTSLGWKPDKRPLYVLNFLCSPVVPRYGFTDKGLVDAQELTLLEVSV